MDAKGYWFKSSKFEIEPGEDKEINPGVYGKQLAIWLKQRLEEHGYGVEDIINEDWGRCLMCSRDPFNLWIGCANMWDEQTVVNQGPSPDDPPPAKEHVIWHCFVTAEVPFWKRWFRKIDTAPAVSKLFADLGKILRAETEITLVNEP